MNKDNESETEDQTILNETKTNDLKIAVWIEVMNAQKSKTQIIKKAIRKDLPMSSICKIIREKLNLNPIISLGVYYENSVVNLSHKIGSLAKGKKQDWLKIKCQEMESFGRQQF